MHDQESGLLTLWRFSKEYTSYYELMPLELPNESTCTGEYLTVWEQTDNRSVIEWSREQ